MRLAIDGQLLTENRTGMGVYTFNILRYWDKNRDNVIIYFPGQPPKDLEDLAETNGFQIRKLKKCNYFKWEQIVLPREVKKDEADLLWCPYCTAPLIPPCPISVVIHDAIYMNLRIRDTQTLYKKLGVIYRRITVPRAAKNAISVATVSEFSQKEICKHFPVVKKKITVIPNGIESTEKPSDLFKNEFFRKSEIIGKYILGFGSLEARKNTLALIKAYEQLDVSIKKEYQLVLFGFRGYENSTEKAYIEKQDLVTYIKPLGYITDEEKKCLYSNCSVFVFPSLSEGFGIPLLEAFDSDVPVITSNVTSLPEVAGKGALLVDPENIESISKSISKILMNPELTSMLISEGKKQVEKYKWNTASKKMQELLHRNMESALR